MLFSILQFGTFFYIHLWFSIYLLLKRPELTYSHEWGFSHDDNLIVLDFIVKIGLIVGFAISILRIQSAGARGEISRIKLDVNLELFTKIRSQSKLS